MLVDKCRLMVTLAVTILLQTIVHLLSRARPATSVRFGPSSSLNHASSLSTSRPSSSPPPVTPPSTSAHRTRLQTTMDVHNDYIGAPSSLRFGGCSFQDAVKNFTFMIQNNREDQKKYSLHFVRICQKWWPQTLRSFFEGILGTSTGK